MILFSSLISAFIALSAAQGSQVGKPLKALDEQVEMARLAQIGREENELSERVMPALLKGRQLVDEGKAKEAEKYYEIVELNERPVHPTLADMFQGELYFYEEDYKQAASYLAHCQPSMAYEYIISLCHLDRAGEAMDVFRYIATNNTPTSQQADIMKALPAYTDDSPKAIEASAWICLSNYFPWHGGTWAKYVTAKAYALMPENPMAQYYEARGLWSTGENPPRAMELCKKALPYLKGFVSDEAKMCIRYHGG